MKKIIFLVYLTFFLVSNVSYSCDFKLNLKDATSNLKIKSFLKEHNKALCSHDIEKVRQFYDENYKNYDNVSLNELMKILDETFKTYSTLKYDIKIEKIAKLGDLILVKISDRTQGTIDPSTRKKNKFKTGVLDGKSEDSYKKNTKLYSKTKKNPSYFK